MHIPKEFFFTSVFKNQELWYMFSFCFRPRVFNLAIKSHGSRVSTFFKAPTIESMIVILSVMCIVPKYHCLLHDYDIVYSEIIVSSHHLNFGGAPAFMFCFTKGGKRDITLSYLHTMLTTNLFDVSVSYCKTFGSL